MRTRERRLNDRLWETVIEIEDNAVAATLLGRHDENLRVMANEFDARLVARGNVIFVRGTREQVEVVSEALEHLERMAKSGQQVTRSDVKYIAQMVKEGRGWEAESLAEDVILISDRGKPIRPKTEGQRKYVEAMRNYDIVFAIGPAGTGKTYLAMAMAVSALKSKQVARIILTRPAVEAGGEKLGFLPGDIREKFDPYLRPLYDALLDMMDAERLERLIERQIIEIAPLAYMRGRTLNDAFIILDEAQNTTPEQMKMFLTRLGFGSQMVITGDITQIDLPKHRRSGLLEARRILEGVEGIAFIYLTERDTVRHELVQRIIRAYECYEREEEGAMEKASEGTREGRRGPT